MGDKEIDITQAVKGGDSPHLQVYLERHYSYHSNKNPTTLFSLNLRIPLEENFQKGQFIHLRNGTFYFCVRVDWGGDAQAREMQKLQESWERKEYLRLKKKFEEIENQKELPQTKQEELF